MQGSLWAEGQKADEVSKYLPNILTTPEWSYVCDFLC
jgi:hypothetical protein